MELIRQILLDVEAQTDPLHRGRIEIEGRSRCEIDYHVSLLVESGLVVGLRVADREHAREACLVQRITWNGHEFLDSARSNNRWETAKRVALTKGGSSSFEAIKTALGALTREAVILAVRTGGY